MNKSIVVFMAISAAISAQSRVSNAPVSSTVVSRPTGPGAPVLGFIERHVPGAPDPQLFSLLGSAAKPFMGPKLLLPAAVDRVYLPPRQQYALLQFESGDRLQVAALSGAAGIGRVVAVPGSIKRPDLVAFSPRGDAAALYSRTNSRVEVLGHLPSEPVLVREINVEAAGQISQIAVTDDGTLVAIASIDGIVRSSNLERENIWEALSVGLAPGAWSFIPGTHQLVISDPIQKAIVLLSDLDHASATAHVLASQTAPIERVSVSKDGDCLLLVSSDSKVSSINLVDPGQVPLALDTPHKGRVDGLFELRDGRSFVLSSEVLALVKLGDMGSASASSTPVRLTQ